ncbi:DNA primase small subunit [Rhizoctonia solani AG-1 IB]|uniref:DNA primase n=1 Tax=Thanatephorus cucumeris (strain AG1-IB / isolate 7/3/14) TaxID=1108050 RepID=A0A0B7G2E4_THACB|nr:DNA primase small subunit [Rhizoctonia solani AG-1 IB]
MDSEEVDVSPEVTMAFYRRLYPFKPIHNWLNQEHAPSRLITNREFALTLQGDVYLRYNSFSSAEEMKKEICRYNPTRFEIGPVYSARPRDKKSLRPGAFTPTARELVFDIDMTDYDSIRTCCAGKGICRRCWKFIAVAVKVLDRTLRQDFGYKHLMWVYSGRRGIHLWISDKEAMDLTDDERRAIVQYIEVVKGGKDQVKKVNIRSSASGNTPGSIHPALQKSLGILSEEFGDLILIDQDVFAKPDSWQELLQLLPDKDLVNDLQMSWDGRAIPSEAKWKELRSAISGMKENRKALMKAVIEDIVFQYSYPRIDTEVSKHRNHLLKAPFCVHPGTGRVCVPVDPAHVDEFDPEAVPTIGGLLRELDNLPATQPGVEHHSDWEHTSLKPYVEMLERHASAIMNDARERKRGLANKSLDF